MVGAGDDGRRDGAAAVAAEAARALARPVVQLHVVVRALLVGLQFKVVKHLQRGDSSAQQPTACRRSGLVVRQAEGPRIDSQSGQIAYFHGVKKRLSTLGTGDVPRGSDST